MRRTDNLLRRIPDKGDFLKTNNTCKTRLQAQSIAVRIWNLGSYVEVKWNMKKVRISKS